MNYMGMRENAVFASCFTVYHLIDEFIPKKRARFKRQLRSRRIRQFWKQCRERGVCDASAVRELRSRTLESESPIVSYLRVAEYHENLAEEHTTT